MVVISSYSLSAIFSSRAYQRQPINPPHSYNSLLTVCKRLLPIGQLQPIYVALVMLPTQAAVAQHRVREWR